MSGSEVQVTCPTCHQTISIPGNWLGKRRPCPACKEWVSLPAEAPAPAAPDAPVPPAADAVPAAADTSPPPADAAPAKPLSFADRMKLAAERGTTQIRRKEEDRARREAARSNTGDFEDRMRAAKLGSTGAIPGGLPDAASDTLSPGPRPGTASGGAGAADGARDWSTRTGGEDDEQRRITREAKMIEASYAPEKIGKISVVLCAAALLMFAVSFLIFLFGGVMSVATQSVPGEGGSNFGAHAVMSFSACMFGFSPVCAVCGFILGVHSLVRSQHNKIWGALGAGLNGILVLPPAALCLIGLAARKHGLILLSAWFS